MQNDSLAVTATSPENALEQMLAGGEKDARKLLDGLRAKGYIITAGKETEDDVAREGEPMPPKMADVIGQSVRKALGPDLDDEDME